jgi:hypothetical protein
MEFFNNNSLTEQRRGKQMRMAAELVAQYD